MAAPKKWSHNSPTKISPVTHQLALELTDNWPQNSPTEPGPGSATGNVARRCSACRDNDRLRAWCLVLASPSNKWLPICPGSRRRSTASCRRVGVVARRPVSVDLEALLPSRAGGQRWALRGWFLAVRSLPCRYWPVQRAMTCCGSSCSTSARNAAARPPRTVVTARPRWEMDTEPSARTT